jgi:hypothetical protein
MQMDGQDTAINPALLAQTIVLIWSCVLQTQNKRQGKLGAMVKEHSALLPMFQISSPVKRYYAPPVKRPDSVSNAKLASFAPVVALLQNLSPFLRMVPERIISRHSLNQSMAALPYCRHVYYLVNNDKLTA